MTITDTFALRADLDATLGTLIDEMGDTDGNPAMDLDLSQVRVNASALDPSIVLGSVEVPYTDRGALALADALQVPTPFIKRIGKQNGIEAQGELLSMLLNYHSGGAIRAEYREGGGLMDLRDPNQLSVRPTQVLRVAERVLGSHDSPVQRLVDTGDEFSFDVHVPFDHSSGVGGDADALIDLPSGLESYSWTSKVPLDGQQRVGDLTAAGLRFTVDRKRGLAPSVQPWMMRLVCTNGMETTTDMTKIDARGLSVEQVVADLEEKARLAFERTEQQMAHFYDLRNQQVTNPERRLRAMARERGIPARSVAMLMDAAPEALGDETTEFDVINLVTNLANHSSIRNAGGRMLLERAGGAVVNDHALRCSACHTALVN